MKLPTKIYQCAVVPRNEGTGHAKFLPHATELVILFRSSKWWFIIHVPITFPRSPNSAETVETSKLHKLCNYTAKTQNLYKRTKRIERPLRVGNGIVTSHDKGPSGSPAAAASHAKDPSFSLSSSYRWRLVRAAFCIQHCCCLALLHPLRNSPSFSCLHMHKKMRDITPFLPHIFFSFSSVHWKHSNYKRSE